MQGRQKHPYHDPIRKGQKKFYLAPPWGNQPRLALLTRQEDDLSTGEEGRAVCFKPALPPLDRAQMGEVQLSSSHGGKDSPPLYGYATTSKSQTLPNRDSRLLISLSPLLTWWKNDICPSCTTQIVNVMCESAPVCKYLVVQKLDLHFSFSGNFLICILPICNFNRCFFLGGGIPDLVV